MVSLTTTEIRLTADQDLMAKFQRIRGLWAHALPDANWADLFSRMTDLTLAGIEPREKRKVKFKVNANAKVNAIAKAKTENCSPTSNSRGVSGARKVNSSDFLVELSAEPANANRTTHPARLAPSSVPYDERWWSHLNSKQR